MKLSQGQFIVTVKFKEKEITTWATWLMLPTTTRHFSPRSIQNTKHFTIWQRFWYFLELVLTQVHRLQFTFFWVCLRNCTRKVVALELKGFQRIAKTRKNQATHVIIRQIKYFKRHVTTYHWWNMSTEFVICRYVLNCIWWWNWEITLQHVPAYVYDS